MKKFATTVMILSASIAGSALAFNDYAPENDVFMGEYVLQIENRGLVQSKAQGLGSQPEVGSATSLGESSNEKGFLIEYYGIDEHRTNNR